MATDGSVALVTGAGRRLGREIALALGRADFDVVVHYGTSATAAEETAGGLERLGRRAWRLAADLSDLAAIENLFDEIESRAGRLDVLVNSAATFGKKGFDEVEPQDWERAMAVNLRAPFFCTQRAARLMRRGAGGSIVNVADLSGVTPWLGYPVHGISKSGMIHLTRTAARELGPEIRVNAVVPGPILPPPGEDPSGVGWQRRGDRLPLGRTGDPSDVAEAVVFLAGAGYVTGAILPVDGGEHLSPQGGR